AYAAGDLLVLLELQLQMEQIDAKALAGMAADRLVHYNRVLDEQSRRLQEELAGVTAPYTMSLQGRMPRELMPDAVLRALDGDIRSLRAMLRSLETDRIAFQNIDELKSSLRHYRIGDADDDALNIPEPRVAAAGRSRRRGR
ncbi:MAG: hypothetical protein M3Y67_05125, partial [Pseudomonadota bacterium]|nr:hypothetical protein [Pseudomonadota bacterium]